MGEDFIDDLDTPGVPDAAAPTDMATQDDAPNADQPVLQGLPNDLEAEVAAQDGWEVPAALPDEDDDAHVYGLDGQKPGDKQRRRRRSSAGVPWASVLALALLLCGLGAVAAWRMSQLAEDEARAARIAAAQPIDVEPEPEPKPQEAPEEQPEEVVEALGQDDILALATHELSDGTEDVSLEGDEAEVAIRAGKVMVTHKLSSEVMQDLLPSRLARLAGVRANGLSAALSGRYVAADGAGAVPFDELIWVVRDPSGAAFIAVSERAGQRRTSSDEYGVLVGSHGYRMSDTLNAAVGGGSVLPAAGGVAPVDLAGKQIDVTAIVPGMGQVDTSASAYSGSSDEASETASKRTTSSKSNRRKTGSTSAGGAQSAAGDDAATVVDAPAQEPTAPSGSDAGGSDAGSSTESGGGGETGGGSESGGDSGEGGSSAEGGE